MKNALLASLRKLKPAGVTVPITGMNFELSTMSYHLANFSEIRGLSIEVETERYHEGGVNHSVYAVPKGVRGTNLVLKAGLTGGTFLWDWFTSFTTSGLVTPIPLQLTLRDADAAKDVRSWTIANAYPVKWEGPTFDAGKGDIAFETIELTHQGVWQQGTG